MLPRYNGKEILDLAGIHLSDTCQAIDLYSSDSADFGVSQWEYLVRTIEKHYEWADAFIIVSGTDTITYTAAALSFAFRAPSKPIIFTGSMLPIDAIGSDATDNLYFALRTAEARFSRVVVAFHKRIMLGVRAAKLRASYNQWNTMAFSSPNFPLLGKDVDGSLRISSAGKKLQTIYPTEPICHGYFSREVHVTTVTPFTRTEDLDCRYRALILVGLGGGSLPNPTDRPILNYAQTLSRTRTVAIVSGTKYGSVVEGYASSPQIMSAGDMSLEAAQVKLAWLISLTDRGVLDAAQVQTAFLADLRGERQSRKSLQNLQLKELRKSCPYI